MKILFASFLILLTTFVGAQDYNFPKEIQLVFDYVLEKDYPEQFGESLYQIRPVDWQIIDIEDDGVTEVFLQTFPHYKQSPSITIFQIKNDSVSRIVEGFAPGHLIDLSTEDDYFDPHSTGMATDMQLDTTQKDMMRKIAISAMNWGMSVVLYKNFIHSDKREGKGTFIDLSYLDDYAGENTCANFQFEKPDKIIAGRITNEEDKFFIAKVNDELFCYRIKGFLESKFVDKEVKITDVPNDFVDFKLENGFIRYINTKGEITDLNIQI